MLKRFAPKKKQNKTKEKHHYTEKKKIVVIATDLFHLGIKDKKMK